MPRTGHDGDDPVDWGALARRYELLIIYVAIVSTLTLVVALVE